MLGSSGFNSVRNSLVPISRFNKGEANKIFEEVKTTGFKIVLKNNIPTCVLITPETYEKMMEIIEDYNLFMEVEKRMDSTKTGDFFSQETVMKKLGISETDLKDVTVEIE